MQYKGIHISSPEHFDTLVDTGDITQGEANVLKFKYFDDYEAKKKSKSKPKPKPEPNQKNGERAMVPDMQYKKG